MKQDEVGTVPQKKNDFITLGLAVHNAMVIQISPSNQHIPKIQSIPYHLQHFHHQHRKYQCRIERISKRHSKSMGHQYKVGF